MMWEIDKIGFWVGFTIGAAASLGGIIFSEVDFTKIIVITTFTMIGAIGARTFYPHSQSER